MKEMTNSVTLQSVGGNVQNRIDEVVAQFNEWLAGKNPSSMLLNFTTSEEHPLRMEEILDFFKGSPYFDGQHDIEWAHSYDDSLGEDMRIEILDRTMCNPS